MAKLVNWHDFEQKLKGKKLTLFGLLDTTRIFGVSHVAAIFLLHRYAKRGFIVRLKRGLYAFADAPPPDLYIANKLYEPSYVSLEFALSYHRIIPETVYEITSVTTKPSRRFQALGKTFSYRRVKRDAFTGYSTVKQGTISFSIAEPEKAFVDLLYLRLRHGQKPVSRFASFAKEKLNQTKVLHYANLFEDKRLVGIVATTLR